MSEYIDKDALMETLKDAHKRLIETIGHTRHTIGFEGAMDYVEEAPAADVVEVVRCKDCKHHEELLNNNDENVLCWVHGLDVIVDGNGYCNYGERKEQENE